jgi:CRP-like cAMP-binding protein
MKRIPRYAMLSLDSREKIKRKSNVKCYKKGDVLFSEDSNDTIYRVILSGYVSKYFITENGIRYNISLLSSNELLMCPKSYFNFREIDFGAKALTDVEVLELPVEELELLCIEDDEIKEFKRDLMISFCLSFEIGIINLLTTTAIERCKALLDKHPLIFETIPRYEIAEYLGVTKVQMSRLTKELNI